MNLLGGSFRIGRLFDINIRIHMLFLLYVGFRIFETLQRGGSIGVVGFMMALLFGIVLAHEFGHCFGARLVGGYANDIVLWPLGGLAYAHAPHRPWPQFVTVAAGPAVNVVFCVLSALILVAATRGGVAIDFTPFSGGVESFGGRGSAWMRYLAFFYDLNFWILCFNLLPIYPLDGGQLLHSLLWPFLGLQRATIAAASIGLCGAAFFAFRGISGMQTGMGGGMLFWIAIFGGLTCWRQLQYARQGLLVEDSRFEGSYGPSYDPTPWWRRVFRLRARSPRTADDGNPNPGGWEAKQRRLAEEEAELDRILKKVSAHGIHSLSYVERQRLEQITRERQERERELQRDARG